MSDKILNVIVGLIEKYFPLYIANRYGKKQERLKQYEQKDKARIKARKIRDAVRRNPSIRNWVRDLLR